MGSRLGNVAIRENDLRRGIDLQKFEIECYSGILKTNFYSYSSLENRISWKNRLWR